MFYDESKHNILTLVSKANKIMEYHLLMADDLILCSPKLYWDLNALPTFDFFSWAA